MNMPAIEAFLSGDSVGPNIAQNMATTAGHSHPRPQPEPEYGLQLVVPVLGVALVHPYFWGSDPAGSEAANPDAMASVDRLWPFLCPSHPDHDDQSLNPVAADAPCLVDLECSRGSVCVAENDLLKERGWLYYQELGRRGWIGVVEIQETQGEDHGFRLFALGTEKAQDMFAFSVF